MRWASDARTRRPDCPGTSGPTPSIADQAWHIDCLERTVAPGFHEIVDDRFHMNGCEAATRPQSRERTQLEEIMNPGAMSLRLLVEKWLAPTPAMPARIARFSRMTPDQRRYVCVESLRPGGTLVIFFFRHDDRSWRVFPPAAPRPAMKGC